MISWCGIKFLVWLFPGISIWLTDSVDRNVNANRAARVVIDVGAARDVGHVGRLRVCLRGSADRLRRTSGGEGDGRVVDESVDQGLVDVGGAAAERKVEAREGEEFHRETGKEMRA